MKKSRIALLLAAVLTLTSIQVPAFAEEAVEDTAVLEEVMEVTKDEEEAAPEIVDVVTEEIEEEAPDAEKAELVSEGILDEAVESSTDGVEPEADDCVDLSEEILGVSVSGNVVVKFKEEGAVKDFYYGDKSFADYKKLVEAEFEVAPEDKSAHSLDIDRIYIRKDRDAHEMINGNWGLYFNVAEDGKTLCVKTETWAMPGNYTVKAYAMDSDSYAEYSFTIKPNVYSLVLYTNKMEGNQTIYSDGKKQLALSMTADSYTIGYNYKSSKKSVKPAIDVVSANQCKVNGTKIIVPKGFKGTEVITVTGSVKDVMGQTVYSEPVVLTITDKKQTPAALAIGMDELVDADNDDWEYVERFRTNSEKKLTVSADKIDGLQLWTLDENGNQIRAKLKAKGKSIKIKTYRDENTLIATGKPGVTTITATSKVGKEVAKFDINVTSYDNTGLVLYQGASVSGNVILAEEAINPSTNIYIYAGKTSDFDSAVTSSVGGYKLSAKGGKIIKNGRGYIVMPSAATTELKLKAGSKTTTYSIKNAAYEPSSTIKNASIAIYSEYGYGKTIKTKLSGVPAGTTKLRIEMDLAAYNKMKYPKYNTYYSITNKADMNNKVDGDELSIDFSWLSVSAAGKYTVFAYPLNDMNQYTAKPFKITFSVSNKVPAPSVKLAKTKFELKKQTGDATDITLANAKNVEKINYIRLQNGYNKKVMNSFTSFFKVTDLQITSDKDGKLTMSAKMTVKDSDFTEKDLNGKMVINVTMVNGASKDIIVPVSIKVTN